MARLFADENFPEPVVRTLRQLGHDAITLRELGYAHQGLSDDAVLRLASQDNRAVLTINRRHYIALHRRSANHSGIVACTLDLDFSGQADRVHAAIAQLNSMHGQLIRVNRPNLHQNP